MAGEIENLGQYGITGGPGSTPGSKNHVTRLRNRILETYAALDKTNGNEEGREDEFNWLLQVARKQPGLFVKLLDKILPAKTEADVNIDTPLARMDVSSMTADELQAARDEETAEMVARQRELEAIMGDDEVLGEPKQLEEGQKAF